jgi:hypothetical protein
MSVLTLSLVNTSSPNKKKKLHSLSPQANHTDRS